MFSTLSRDSKCYIFKLPFDVCSQPSGAITDGGGSTGAEEAGSLTSGGGNLGKLTSGRSIFKQKDESMTDCSHM